MVLALIETFSEKYFKNKNQYKGDIARNNLKHSVLMKTRNFTVKMWFEK